MPEIKRLADAFLTNPKEITVARPATTAETVKQALVTVDEREKREEKERKDQAKIADLNDPRFDFDRCIPESLAFLRSAGIEREIPLIAAGGIRSRADIARIQALGGAAAQLGTPFAVTSEGDASPGFKQVLAGARLDHERTGP